MEVLHNKKSRKGHISTAGGQGQSCVIPACPDGPHGGIYSHPAAVPSRPLLQGGDPNPLPREAGATLLLSVGGWGGGQSKCWLTTRAAVTTGLVRGTEGGEDVLEDKGFEHRITYSNRTTAKDCTRR